jgi:transcriptional regulator with GAF, ATPase, and Fis domain
LDWVPFNLPKPAERGLPVPSLLHGLVSEIAAGFIDLPAAELGRGIDLALQSAGEILELDRCLVGLLTEEQTRIQVVHKWERVGGAGAVGATHAAAMLPAVLDCLLTGRELVCECSERCTAALLAQLQRLAGETVSAVAAMPLRIARELRGVVVFASTRGPRPWLGDVLTAMRLTIELIANALDRQQQQEDLRARQAFDALLIRSSRAFVAAPVGSLDEVLPAVLADVGQSLGFERAVVFLRDPATQWNYLLHEWGAPGMPSLRPEFARVDRNEISYWPPGYEHGEWSIVDLESVPAYATAYHRMRRYDTRMMAVGPISRAGQILGSLALHARSRRPCSTDFLRQLTLLGELFASAIARMEAERARERAYKELEILKSRLERERDYLRQEVRSERQGDQMLGTSPAMQAVFRAIAAVAATPTTALIRGESGVGKELIACAIHDQSARKDGPLVKVNCASVPRELFESEFFGHVRGSFTGAHKDRAGRFELADRGTIFLDEVGDIPLDLQAKLLRVLQEGQYERVGEDRTRTANVRVIAATNRDLEKEVAAGRFRCDLYYRLNAFPIEIPPLRQRGDDITLLARHFLALYARRAGKSGLTLLPEHERLLLGYHFPGNVRELQHVIERAVILSEDAQLRLDLALPKAALAVPAPDAQASTQAAPATHVHRPAPLTMSEFKRLERDNIVSALARTHGQIAGAGGAAELLGVKPSTLRDRVRALGIDRNG